MATLSEVFTDISNAIRTCNNNDEKYKPTEMADAILNLEHSAIYTGTEEPDNSLGEDGDLFFIVEEIEKITFTIGETLYTAEVGMTWGEWVDSGYNTGGYSISDNYISTPTGFVCYSALDGLVKFTNYTDVIIDGYNYTIASAGHSGGSDN